MQFSVPDMICGHCSAAIEAAIRHRDPSARITCDLDAHSVRVETVLDPRAVAAAIEGAGYGVRAI
ncbi:heavy-metal-associated domain-containing protein [Rhodovulum steppense]|uniref:Copper chaperone n=1 Tax=Rhodovulum steppense TaxID=540251 RepID=A0A4R1YU08_9RHOB|nr:heavy-metal-associated domain-containing protein [Rhodovulum steppense]TCM84540.1 copper chaperone [Rhodovulum steppense]